MFGRLIDLGRWLNPYTRTTGEIEELSALRMAKKMEAERQKQIKHIQESVLYGHIPASSLQENLK